MVGLLLVVFMWPESTPVADTSDAAPSAQLSPAENKLQPTLTSQADDKWESLFDGKSIGGWKREGGSATYEAKGGMIVGTTAEGSKNTVLCKGLFSDFILELDVLCDLELNSGIQIRSHVYDKDTPPGVRARPHSRKRGSLRLPVRDR